MQRKIKPNPKTVDGSHLLTARIPYQAALDSMSIDEDGNLYAIGQGGFLEQKIFQQLAIGAAYTPASLGGDGKIYTQNNGHLFVVGQ